MMMNLLLVSGQWESKFYLRRVLLRLIEHGGKGAVALLAGEFAGVEPREQPTERRAQARSDGGEDHSDLTSVLKPMKKTAWVAAIL